MYKEKQSREWNGGREVSSPYPFPRLNLIVRVPSEKNITLSGEIIPCNAKYQRFFKKEREKSPAQFATTRWEETTTHITRIFVSKARFDLARKELRFFKGGETSGRW